MCLFIQNSLKTFWREPCTRLSAKLLQAVIYLTLVRMVKRSNNEPENHLVWPRKAWKKQSTFNFLRHSHSLCSAVIINKVAKLMLFWIRSDSLKYTYLQILMMTHSCFQATVKTSTPLIDPVAVWHKLQYLYFGLLLTGRQRFLPNYRGTGMKDKAVH